MSYAAITGWGMAVPDQVVTNAELGSALGVDVEWITRRTGIEERRIASPSESTSSLAIDAGRRALERAGLDAADLDLVVVATTTPDRPIPATAPVVQAELGARNAGAFDLNAACAGFLSALVTATGLIRAGTVSRCLVIGAEVLSRFVDWSDPGTCVLFGDGAGAAVVGRSDEPAGLMFVDLGSDGSGASLLEVPAGGSARPASPATVAGREHFVRMNGQEVFRAAVRTMVSSSKRTLRSAELSSSDVDLFICHQANRRIVAECADRLGLSPERVFSNIARYANTSAASVPIALCEAAEQGLLGPGSRLLLTAIGAGFAWASGLAVWTAARQASAVDRGTAALTGAGA